MRHESHIQSVCGPTRQPNTPGEKFLERLTLFGIITSLWCLDLVKYITLFDNLLTGCTDQDVSRFLLTDC